MGDVKRNGFVWALHPADHDPWISGEILRTGGFEPLETAILTGLVGPGDVVVDVGANIGWHTLALARAVGPGGRVYAFEPASDTFALLQKNVEANGLENVVTLFHAAVSDRSGNLKLHRSENNPGDHRVAADPAEMRDVETVRSVALDDVLAEVSGVALIKIDIQGHEPAAIRGMSRLLARSPRAVLFTEFWPYGLSRGGHEDGVEAPRAFAGQLAAMGLELVEIDTTSGGLVDPADIPHLLRLHAPEKQTFTNLLCFQPGVRSEQRLVNLKQQLGRRELDLMALLREVPIWMMWSERMILYALVLALQPRSVLEVGTQGGGATQVLARALDNAPAMEAGLPAVEARLFTWDSAGAGRVSQAIRDSVLHRVTFVASNEEGGQGNQGIAMAARLAITRLGLDGPGAFDFVLLDHRHSFAGVVEDLLQIDQYALSGAVILIHDAHHNTVRKAVDHCLGGPLAGRYVDSGLISQEVSVDKGTGERWGGLRMLRRN